MKLRTKLLVGYVVIAAVIIIVLGIVLYNYSLHVFTEKAKTKSYGEMKQINSNIENNIREMDLLVNYLYSRKVGNFSPFTDIFMEYKADVPASLLRADWEFNKLFEDIFYFRDDCSGIFIYGDSGISFSKFLYAASGNYEIDSEWYKKTLENKGRTTILGTHRQFYSENGTLVFSVAKQIISPVNNRGIGVILLDFDLSMLKKTFHGMDLGNGSSIILSDSQGNIVYHTDESYIMDKLDDNIALQVKGKESGAVNIDLKGRKYLLIFDTLDLPEWKVVITIPINTLMQAWYVMEKIILSAGLILIVMILIISYLLSGLITKPVLNLTRQVHDVEMGNYSVSLTYDSRDEIGQLSKGLASMVHRIKELIQKEYKAKLAENESELKALQAQINPHFIYNTLEIISSMAAVRNAPEIDDVAIALAGMLRYSIKTKGNIVPLSSEIQHIDDYMAVYHARFSNGIRLRKEIDDRFLKYGILKLTLQPLVENAIVHGFDGHTENGEIVVSAEEKDGILYLHVTDNGSGITKAKLDEIGDIFRRDREEMTWEIDRTESIGLRNVNARLFLYYGNHYGIFIEDNRDKGACITVKIPAKNWEG